MARVRDVELNELPADIQPIYRKFAGEYGPFLNQVRVFAHRPPAVKHIMGLLLTLSEEQIRPKRYLEIALVVVSKLNECRYCVAHHTPRAIEHGLSAQAVSSILEPHVEGFDEIDMLVRDYAVQVTNSAGTMRDQIFALLLPIFLFMASTAFLMASSKVKARFEIKGSLPGIATRSSQPLLSARLILILLR